MWWVGGGMTSATRTKSTLSIDKLCHTMRVRGLKQEILLEIEQNKKYTAAMFLILKNFTS